MRSGLPRWTKLSPTLNFTPPNVCSPVGTAARVLFAIRPPTSSANFWLALPCRSMNVGPLVFGAGAARQAAATQAAAMVPRNRDTGSPPTTGRPGPQPPDYPRTAVFGGSEFRRPPTPCYRGSRRDLLSASAPGTVLLAGQSVGRPEKRVRRSILLPPAGDCLPLRLPQRRRCRPAVDLQFEAPGHQPSRVQVRHLPQGAHHPLRSGR